MNKIKEINEQIASGVINEKEAQFPEITEEERIKVKAYYKKVWEAAGSDEFKYNRQRAKMGIEQFSKDGIGAVADEEIKYLIQKYKELT